VLRDLDETLERWMHKVGQNLINNRTLQDTYPSIADWLDTDRTGEVSG